MAELKKSDIRACMLDKRRTMSEDEVAQKSDIILHKLFECESIVDSENVYCYVSCNNEVSTIEVIEMLWNIGTEVAVPKVVNNDIEFYYISSWEDLKPGYMDIPEPIDGLEKAEDKAAPVIVPGIAFTKKGDRLGYGKAYYDRFFEKENKHMKIGIAYGFQIVDSLPVEKHDIRLNRIITEV